MLEVVALCYTLLERLLPTWSFTSSSYVPLTPSKTFLTPDGQFDSIELTTPISQARPRLRSSGIQGVVDPALGDTYPREIYEDMAELALECSVFNKDDRPSMKVINISFHGSNILGSNMWREMDEIRRQYCKSKIVSSFLQAVLNILEPHLKGCEPPELLDTYSSTWESMDSSIPTEASSSANVTTHSTHSRDSKVTTVEMTSTLLPR